jgi:hypothetical protein
MTDPLLEAVDELTLPTNTRVTQDNGDNTITNFVHHEALLTQLENAISSTIGAGAGRTMTAKWALNVLDSDALYQFTIISSTIRDWCRTAGTGRYTHPADGLRAWYTTRLPIPAEMRSLEDPFHIATLHKWANTIRAKLNPSRSLEITAACPICHSDTWTDTDGTHYRHPIEVTYHDQAPDILATAQALCRACDRVWRGSHELRELRWDVDIRESETA